MLEKASNVNIGVATDEATEPPAKKRPSVLDRLLGEDEDKEDSETVSTLEEIQMYFQECPIKRKEDPLCWWRGNTSRFPHLAILAQKYLAASEGVFSVAGIVVDKRRCALTAEMINALVFLHKNCRKIS